MAEHSRTNESCGWGPRRQSGGMLQYLGWQGMLATVRATFPQAKHISTSELASALEDADSAVLLLDARMKEEYDVSHIAGAHWVGEDGEAPELQQLIADFQVQHEAARTKLVACYCSVGYRSARLSQRLASELNVNAVNVEGSLFRWANEGRPVHRGGRQLQAAQVHPYNAVFGKLLDADKRSALPPRQEHVEPP